MSTRPSFHERQSEQSPLIGFLQTRPFPELTEMAGLYGYDFVLLDTEHGLFTDVDCMHALQVLTATDALGMVRLSEHDLNAVGRYMDLGADSIVVPNVTTASQARALVQAMVYPPAGTRGFGASSHRATGYGKDLAVHLKAPRARTALVLMIESALGVANIEEIVAVEGVDGLFVGPFDLSADLGAAGDFSQPGYAQALARIEQAAAARGKLYGTVPHGTYPLETLAARGHRLLLVGADIALIREALDAQLQKARSAIGVLIGSKNAC